MAKEKSKPSDAPEAKAKPKPSDAPEAKAKPVEIASAEKSKPDTPAPAVGEAPPTSADQKKRSGAGRRGKGLRDLLAKQAQEIEKAGALPLKKAVELLKSQRKAIAAYKAKRAEKIGRKNRGSFDETVEVHMCLGIDTTQSDQMVRGSVALPHGIGKSVRVLVFCQGDNVNKAKDAGADVVGGEDLVKKIQQDNFLDFDVAIATQDMMGMVSRLGKVLGPRGLMPTPKAGTVIPAAGDVAAAVREFKAGKVEYRADKSGNVHAGVGKISFDDDKLSANITAFVEQIRAAKPSAVKGNFIQSVTVSSTMGTGIRISI